MALILSEEVRNMKQAQQAIGWPTRKSTAGANDEINVADQ